MGPDVSSALPARPLGTDTEAAIAASADPDATAVGAAAGADGRSLQQRLEDSDLGRAVLSALIALTVIGFVLTNMPQSELKRVSAPVVRPYIDATGLDQNWEVFAPNPRSIALKFHARITYDDGESVTWQLPRGGRIVGHYRFYRWQKWMEYVRADDYADTLWEPTALWLARTYQEPDRGVTEVTLIRRWYDIPAPGSGAEPPPYNEYEFFVCDVADGGACA